MSAVSRFALGSVLAVLIAVAVIDAQTKELDHIVSRVNGRIITQSDVNQARLLRLVPDASSDDAVRVALENRLLILGEIARGNALPPATDQEIAERRAEWLRGVGDNTGELLARARMSESALDAWLKDDLRVRAYLTRQFGGIPESDRVRPTEEWLGRLRQRAGLK